LKLRILCLLFTCTSAFSVTHDSRFCAKGGSGNSPVLGFLQCLLWCEDERDFFKTLNAQQELYSFWLWSRSTTAEFTRKKCSHLSDKWYKGWPRTRCRTYWTFRYSTTWVEGAFRCWNFEKDGEINGAIQETIRKKDAIYTDYISNEKFLEDPTTKDRYRDYTKLKNESFQLEQKKETATKTLSEFKADHDIFLDNVKWRHRAFVSIRKNLLEDLKDRKQQVVLLKAELGDVMKTLFQTQNSISNNELLLRKASLEKMHPVFTKVCSTDKFSEELKHLREHVSLTNTYIDQHRQHAESLSLPEEYFEVRSQILKQMDDIEDLVTPFESIFSLSFDRVVIPPKICSIWPQLNRAIQVSDSVIKINKNSNSIRSFLNDLIMNLRISERNDFVALEIGEIRKDLDEEKNRLFDFYRNGELLKLKQSLSYADKKMTDLKDKRLGRVLLTENENKELNELESSFTQNLERLKSKLLNSKASLILGTRARNLWSKARQIDANMQERDRDFYEKSVLVQLKEELEMDIRRPFGAVNFSSQEEAEVFEEKLAAGERVIQAFELSLDTSRN
jgi:hypothetical protein